MARTALIVHLDIRPESFSEFLGERETQTDTLFNSESMAIHFLMVQGALRLSKTSSIPKENNDFCKKVELLEFGNSILAYIHFWKSWDHAFQK